VTSVVGIDLGGTKVAVATLRAQQLGDSVLQPTDLSSSEALIDQLVAMVDEVREDDFAGVGIGVPSVVEFATGRVVSSVNIPLQDVPLREVLGERLGVPVFVDNDATVAALAEAHDERLQLVAHNLVMLTIGTGVGGGIVLGGRIYRGATGGAGEFGHTLVGIAVAPHVPAAERFPQVGSLERLASGHALDGLGRDFAVNHPESSLGRRLGRGESVAGVDLVQAAHAGDADAIELVQVWAERVGVGIANAINVFDPEEVVIGGGAAQAGALLLEPAVRVALSYVHPGLRGHARVRLARHGVRAGVLGAALLAAQELVSEPALLADGDGQADPAGEASEEVAR
jgi:glucokinase